MSTQSNEFWRGFHTAMELLSRVSRSERAGKAVHGSWRDGMLSQDRDVAEPRMDWHTLTHDDQELDCYIARHVADALITQARGTPMTEWTDLLDDVRQKV